MCVCGGTSEGCARKGDHGFFSGKENCYKEREGMRQECVTTVTGAHTTLRPAAADKRGEREREQYVWQIILILKQNVVILPLYNSTLRWSLRASCLASYFQL